MSLMLNGKLLAVDVASDAELVNGVAATISVPRRDPADSFVLHAPLELTARAALLPYVAATRRADAREHIVRMAAQFNSFGPAIAERMAVDESAFPSVADAVAALGAAIEHADLERADEVAAWIGAYVDPTTLRSSLADVVAPSLAAAGHGSIFLYLLPRVAARGEHLTSMLRPLVRELARYPELQLSWQRDLEPEPDAHQTMGKPDSHRPDGLWDALASVPRLGVPGSDFIFPVMHQVESAGIAANVLQRALGGVGTINARSTIMRVAAQSMLHEPDTHAPYGWSHCLTMPQAVLGNVPYSESPDQLIAIAATYVVGFRAAFGSVDLPALAVTKAMFPINAHGGDSAVALTDVLRQGADRATVASVAARAFLTEPDQVRGVLATYASSQEDAHLVKYVLASFDAAAADPTCGTLYMAAAASLCAFWQQVHPNEI